MQDATTLFEIEVLTLLRQYLAGKTKPVLIGPDRDTVQHTVNTLSSYDKSNYTLYARMEYRKLVDIVGTQARYVDNTATADNYLKLTKG